MTIAKRVVTYVFILASSLFLVACGADFETGNYSSGVLSYQFNEDGKGQILGAVSGPGQPFDYDIEGDLVVVKVCEECRLEFRKVDDSTLERVNDSRRFTRQ